MTGGGVDRSASAPHRRREGKHGWAHRVVIPDGDPFRPFLADLWSVHLPDPRNGIVYSFTVELTSVDLFHGGVVVPHHTLWVTQQPMPGADCTFGGWLPGYVHVRYEFRPAATMSQLGFVYEATEALVSAVIDHGPVWFTGRGVAALVAADVAGRR